MEICYWNGRSIFEQKKNFFFNCCNLGLSWPWSYGIGSWIYNYLCNQCLSPLTLWVRIPLGRGVHHTPLCDEVCQWLADSRWFSLGTLVSSTNKTDRHDIFEILLKVALNTKITMKYLHVQGNRPPMKTTFLLELVQFTQVLNMILISSIYTSFKHDSD